MATTTSSPPLPSARRRDLRELARRRLRTTLGDYAAVLGPQAAVELADDLLGLWPSLTPAATVDDNAYARALLRGAAARESLLNDARGPAVSAETAAEILDVSKARVLERVKAGTVFGVRLEKQGHVRLPTWQFTPERAVRAGVAESLGVFRAVEELDDSAALAFFLSPLDTLRRKAPVDLLLAGDARRVIALAEAHVA
jgi:hypothetical protein